MWSWKRRGIFLSKTSQYLGIDASTKLIEIAQRSNPGTEFLAVRAEDCVFPDNIDICYASASLIHVTKKDLENVFLRLQNKMNSNAIVYVYLKWASEYTEITTEIFGTRTYYLYSLDDIREIKGGFKLIESKIVEFSNQRWLEVILQK